MFEQITKSRRSKKGAGRAAAAAAKAPPGYSPAPGSKRGLFRKREGNRWVYWDPKKAGKGKAAKPAKIARVEKLASSVSGAPDMLRDMVKAVATGQFKKAADLGMAYKSHHHKIDEMIELLHVAEVAMHQPIHDAMHAVSAAAGGTGHMVQQVAGMFAMGGADAVAGDRLVKAEGDDDDDDEKEEAAREKKIEAENNAGAEEEDDGDEDAAEERKERARDSFNASLDFGAVVHKAGFTPAQLRHKAAIHAQRYLAADRERGRPSAIEAAVTGNPPTAEMRYHAREREAALAEAERLEGEESLSSSMLDAIRRGR